MFAKVNAELFKSLTNHIQSVKSTLRVHSSFHNVSIFHSDQLINVSNEIYIHTSIQNISGKDGGRNVDTKRTSFNLYCI